MKASDATIVAEWLEKRRFDKILDNPNIEILNYSEWKNEFNESLFHELNRASLWCSLEMYKKLSLHFVEYGVPMNQANEEKDSPLDVLFWFLYPLKNDGYKKILFFLDLPCVSVDNSGFTTLKNFYGIISSESLKEDPEKVKISLIARKLWEKTKNIEGVREALMESYQNNEFSKEVFDFWVGLDAKLESEKQNKYLSEIKVAGNGQKIKPRL